MMIYGAGRGGTCLLGRLKIRVSKCGERENLDNLRSEDRRSED